MGNIIVVTGPSGAGKTTLVNAVAKADSNVCLSISFTSRTPRLGEVNGQHYHFIKRSDFEKRIANSEFIEYAKIYGNYYGTSKKWLLKQLNIDLKKIILLEIDYQGLQQVQLFFPELVSVLVLPPVFTDLIARLKKRGTESILEMDRRLRATQEEIKPFLALDCIKCDYVVVNDDLKQAICDLTSIVHADQPQYGEQIERLKFCYHFGALSDFNAPLTSTKSLGER